MSYTPGPYKKVTYTYDDGSKATYIKQIEGRRLIVAQIMENTGNDEGNADLMAAAPDLLEALKELREWARSFLMDDHPAVVKADEIIRRIEGQ